MKRAQVKPGQETRVKKKHELTLNASLCCFGVTKKIAEDARVSIVSFPRKKEGINLVRVKVDDGREYECFYCDVIKNCEIVVPT